jgi:RNA polymerase sigma-70 factor (ECF subfamily)
MSVSRLTGDRQLADDLLQETYYRFLRAERSFESDAHRRNYLFRIATNLVRDGQRRHQLQFVPVPEERSIDVLSTQTDVARETAHKTDLARAMAQLTSRERELLWLAYAQAHRTRRLRTRSVLRPASIKMLLFRARRHLASLLNPETSPFASTGSRR